MILAYVADVVTHLPDTLTVMWSHWVGLFTPDIVPVPVEGISDSMREALIANGGHSVPGDGQEVVYIDRTSAIQSCFTDAECEYVDTIGAVN